MFFYNLKNIISFNHYFARLTNETYIIIILIIILFVQSKAPTCPTNFSHSTKTLLAQRPKYSTTPLGILVKTIHNNLLVQ